MSAATFHTPTALPEKRAAGKPSFWSRLFDAMMEARMRWAMLEINRRRHLVPEDLLKKNGYTATVNDDGSFPFTR
jgi:hypothetical protein